MTKYARFSYWTKMVKFGYREREVQKSFSILMDWIVNLRGHSWVELWQGNGSTMVGRYWGVEAVRKPRDGELLGPYNDVEGIDSGERHYSPDTRHRDLLEPAGSERIHFTKIK